LLAGIAYLESANVVPHYHHERWDGEGYPQGLAGTDIPLLARIFAIIDQWDAVRSPRPYREPWSDEQALEFIKSGSGTRYDPEIVEGFLMLMESWKTRVPDSVMGDDN
jgi:response regulator RpfG family c-di-GMP phosphodiesterase